MTLPSGKKGQEWTRGQVFWEPARREAGPSRSRSVASSSRQFHTSPPWSVAAGVKGLCKCPHSRTNKAWLVSRKGSWKPKHTSKQTTKASSGHRAPATGPPRGPEGLHPQEHKLALGWGGPFLRISPKCNIRSTQNRVGEGSTLSLFFLPFLSRGEKRTI